MCEVKESQGVAPGRCCQCGRQSRTFIYTFMFSLVIFLVLALACTPLVSSTNAGKNTLISESEVKTVEPTNNPTKVFVRRRIFRKLVKDNSSEVSSTPPTPSPSSTTTRPRTLYSLVKRLESPSTVTGSTLKTSMSNSQSLASRQKFNFQSLKTRLGLAASGIADAQKSTTAQPPSSTTQNSSLVMIPLPPSQRKAYTPVIMQVSKSTTSKPEKVQTFKLNKMFVPIGIYGKVVENDTAPQTESPVPQSSTPITSIRHKGTDSGEKGRKHKGIADTVDITYGRPKVDKVSLTTEHPDASSISITTEYNELFGGNEVRRGDTFGNRRKNNGYDNSGMTLMTPPKLGTPSSSEDSPSTFQDALGSYSSYSQYSNPQKKFTPSSIVDSITDSMSRIPSLVPSLFHKGLTSLASMTSSLKENPFEDENFDANAKKSNKPLVSAPSSYTPKIPASVPGGYISGMGGSRDQTYAASEIKSNKPSKKPIVDISEYETLEYFRKRPHLLAQLRRERAEAAWRRGHGVRLSKGFKPVNAPEYLAKEYYKSTTTQVTPQDIITMQQLRSAKNMRGSWLLRNSNEYAADKNDKVVRIWRNLLDSFSRDEDPDFESVYSGMRGMDEQDPSASSISARRSATQPPSNLNAEWSTIKRKYSKDQINEAKERILTLLDSGYGDEALHDIADDEELQHHYHETSSHMPPPPPPRIKTLSLTKGLSGAAKGAFKDIVKFFKLGVSVGTGHSREPVNYEQVVDAQEEQEIGGSEWKPVRRPLISFSAGISLKNPSSPKKHYHIHEDYDEAPLTHYSSSSKPYIPNTYKTGLNSYYDEYASHSTSPVALKPTPYSYAEDEVIGGSPQTIDYEDEDSLGYGSATSTTYDSPQHYYSAVKHSEPEAHHSVKYYSSVKPGKTPRPQEEDLQDTQASNASSWPPSLANPNEYELVPSSVYLSGNHDPRDIAAVVKPSGVSDDAVRSVLPAGLRSVKILDYPHNSLNSISQVLGGDRSHEGSSSFKNAMKKLRENYVQKENAYLPTGEYDGVGQESSVRVGGSSFGEQRLVGSGGGYKEVSSSPYAAYSQGVRGLTSVSPLSALSNLGATYYNPATHQSGLVGALSGLERGNVFTTADRINDLGRATGVVGGVYQQQYQVQGQAQQQQQAPKDELGFSTNYNLGSNIDPDIAALLKSELDKDDVPEDVRQEFMEAKEQERKEQAAKQQQAFNKYQQAQRRVDNNVDLAQRTLIDSLLSSAAKNVEQERDLYTEPPTTAVPLNSYLRQENHVAQQQFVAPTNPTPPQRFQFQHQAQSRVFHHAPPPPAPPVVTTRFFAPIPITPTLMTTAMKNPRYLNSPSNPVPRYVIELAKKLQGDKSVQGIVRVSAKRGRGLPPIEYLYPVKG